ncbi:MAG: restriction endonuclease subunit R [Deltaproteobacteria bacterium]|nr:restriction endonuclease subunit R [Deltaproteobacteria bacterium]
MDNLLKFIKEIKGDDKFQSLDGPAIKQGIVLKLLSLLEWDPFNMDEIQPEYNVTKGKIDFALMQNDSPKVFISVEKDFKDFEKSEDALLNRAVECEVPIAVFTDGLTWCFLLPLAEGSIEDKKVKTIEIHKDKPEEIQQGFTEFLSKENVTSDKTRKIAEDIYNKRKKRLLIEEHLPKAWEKIMDEPEKWLVGIISEMTENLCGQKPDKGVVEAFIFSEIKEETGTAGSNKNKDSKKKTKGGQGQKDYEGKSVKSFTLEGKEYKVKSWKDMLLKLCSALYEKNKDDFESILYITLNGRDCFSENQHGFLNSGEIKGSNIYVDLDLSAMRTVELCKEMLGHFSLKEKDFIIETA